MSANPLTIQTNSGQSTPATTSTVTRQNSFNVIDVRNSVKDYIETLKEVAEEPLVSPALPNTSTSMTAHEDVSDSTLALAASANSSSEEKQQQQEGLNSSFAQAKVRHLYLPPISDLEAYILENYQSADHFLNVLPDIAEALASYVKTYPDQVKSVWQNLKPILKDIRKRNNLHGRNLVRPAPPVCKKIPYSWTNEHGEVILDDYAWLTDKDDPEVTKYLDEENRYSETCLSHTRTLQKVLYKEFVSRLDENEESVRVMLSDGYSYYSMKYPNAEYRLHCRVDRNGYEETYLDENELSQGPETMDSGTSYFHLGFLRHTPDCKIIAYGIDSNGSERYTAYFKNLETYELLADRIPDCYEDFEFSSCGEYVFFVKIDTFERAYQLKRHRMTTDISEDFVLYEETDEMFCLTMTKSCNKKYLFLNTAAQVTSETRFIDLENPLGEPQILFPRREKIQYSVEHHSFPSASDESSTPAHRGYFYVMTNERSKNNQLFRVPVPSKEEWTTAHKDGITPEQLADLKEVVIENRDFVLIEAFQVRGRHLIVFERSNCMQNIRIVNLEPDGTFETYHYVSFSDGVYSVWPGSVDEEVADLSKSVMFDTNLLRFTYTSFTQPKQVIDYNMDTRVKNVVHEQRVLGPGFDKSLYVSKRLWATGVDGTAVPLSIVYRKDMLGVPTGAQAAAGDENQVLGNPTLLHAYGAYGYCLNPIFSTSRLSLLDRGFVFAVAHVRGGSDMGNGWYEEGKLGKKTNTFMDFISCAEYLIKEGYTSRERLAIYGRSAGGLLIGAVVNMRPDLFQAVLTEVPFVDVINTMFDSTIPWTAFEYEEWGNPADPDICAAMKSYCPYSNVIEGGVYPHMLIVGGMNDPRVAYFEPAKWTAKLRALCKWTKDKSAADGIEEPHEDDVRFKDGDRMLLLKIQEGGHTGSSGQYAYLTDLAFEYAFLISALGANFKPVSSGGKDLSLSGVDYDQYWEEMEGLDDEYEEVEDEATDELPVKVATPLQRFSQFWRRKSANKKPSSASSKTKSPIKERSSREGSAKDKSKSRSTSKHNRTSSLKTSGVKGLFRGLSSKQVDSENTEEPPVVSSPTTESSEQQPQPLTEVDSESATELRPPAENRLPRRSPSSTPTGSKASLRHQLYPHEDESGRVQSTGKVYNFLSKFF